MEKWLNQNTDNEFKSDISSLFKKVFIRMTRFLKSSAEEIDPKNFYQFVFHVST